MKTKPLLPLVSLAAAPLLFCGAPKIFAQGGVPLWTNSYSGSSAGVAVDASGNVFVTGIVYGSGGGWTTIAYSGAGIPLWTNLYGPYINDVAAVAVDASGNVFVTGDYNDFVTIAYSGAGVPLWTNRYSESGNGAGFTSGIAVDGSSNVFVTGTSPGGKSGNDWATIKYSNAGVPLWTNIYNGSGNGDDYSHGIALDKSGNVFVIGDSDESGVGSTTTIKYSGTGAPLWTERYYPIHGALGVEHIVVDSAGNAFMAGGLNGVDVTIAYSGAGFPLWTNRFGTNADGYHPDVGGIAVDAGGNVFVTGTLFDSSDNLAYGTIKYSGKGAPLWTNLYYIDPNVYGGAGGMAVDSSGNAFVTGAAGMVAYSGAGALLWTNRYGPLSRNIAVDNNGNVFVTGGGQIIKYSSSIPAPHLDFQRLNHQLVLNWTNAGFTLQSAPDLTATFTNVPSATSPFTNPVTAPQQFFRLKEN